MSVDLSTTSPLAKSAISIDNIFEPAHAPTLAYGSDWAFDSTTMLSICSDFDGGLPVNCNVQNLKVVYKIPTIPESIHFSNIRKLFQNA